VTGTVDPAGIVNPNDEATSPSKNDGGPMAERSGVPRLGSLTWPEAAERFRRDPRLLCPVGSLMQHGPHLPLDTDFRITTALAEGIGARHDVLIAPTLPFGAGSDVDAGYAGAALLAHKTLHRALNDLVADWVRQGVEDLVLLTSNGFGPHYHALVSVMGADIRIRAVDCNVVDLSPALRTPQSPERAGEIETALMMYLSPGAVRQDRMEDVELSGSVLAERMDGTEPVPLPGSAGVIGRPTAATAEKGKRIYEYLVQYVGDRLYRRGRD